MICQEKDLSSVPRAQQMPLSEIERVYDTICEKTGDEAHDAAFDTFQMQEFNLKCIFWCDDESVEL